MNSLLTTFTIGEALGELVSLYGPPVELPYFPLPFNFILPSQTKTLSPSQKWGWALNDLQAIFGAPLSSSKNVNSKKPV